MNTKGLYGKYKIEKSDGKLINPNAKYFVLRYDSFGDPAHINASRKALAVYAREIEEHIPELANDLRDILDNISK